MSARQTRSWMNNQNIRFFQIVELFIGPILTSVWLELFCYKSFLDDVTQCQSASQCTQACFPLTHYRIPDRPSTVCLILYMVRQCTINLLTFSHHANDNLNWVVKFYHSGSLQNHQPGRPGITISTFPLSKQQFSSRISTLGMYPQEDSLFIYTKNPGLLS